MKKPVYIDGVIREIDTDEATVLSFLKKFTTEERIAIRTAAKDSVILEDFMYLLNAAQNINYTDPALIAGMDMLAQVGLLTTERVTAIMAH